MPRSLEEIKSLLLDTEKTITQIATSLGITRQALYERLRKAGIPIGERRHENDFKSRFSREELFSLYNGNKVTIDQIALRLNTTAERIMREFQFHGIRVRSRSDWNLVKYPFLVMEIGECFDLPLKDGKMRSVTNLYRQAKAKGIRITIRRKDATTAILTRTPALTEENVLRFIKDGKTFQEIAQIFGASTQTISRMVTKKVTRAFS